MKQGKVWLVGAGPGDPKLISIKGMECIQQADVVMFDRLVNRELLRFCSADCEQIDVGKQSCFHLIPQDEINRIMISKAQEGKRVVRLKSGDPYVFGRGGEEAQTLVQAGVAFEVVPGVSSAIGGLAYAGIPVTHRDCSSSFHVITGHLKDGSHPLHWQALAQLNGTLIILMGIANLAEIASRLVEHGRAADTPTAIVMWASHAQQRMVKGTLATIAEVAQQQGIEPPGLIVIGDVVNLQETLDFTRFLEA